MYVCVYMVFTFTHTRVCLFACMVIKDVFLQDNQRIQTRQTF